ncbi:MAG: signal peptide peptidase SppA [Thermodesulfobacteriota bacterium]
MRYMQCALCLLCILLTGCAYVNVPLYSSLQPFEETVLEGSGEKKILLLNISGVISEEQHSPDLGLRQTTSLIDRVKEELEKAERDRKIVGTVIRINSPGGSVSATDIIHHELMNYKKENKVKIVACLTDVATSGGYYIASAADEIIAHPTSITGGIGVITMKFTIEKLLSKVGIEQETIKSAEKKDLWSPFRTSTPDEKMLMQTIIDAFHQRFVTTVYEGRKPKLTRQEVESLADGRIFTAEQALDAKLIDRIGYLDDALKAMKTSLGLENPRVVTYHRPGAYKSTIYSGQPDSSQREIQFLGVQKNHLDPLAGIRFMYLWRP